MKRIMWSTTMRHVVLLSLGVLTFIPLIMLLLLSFKDLTQFNTQRWSLTFPLHFSNYATAWDVIAPFIRNSFVISGVTVIGVMVLSCLAAYPLARLTFFMKEKIYVLIIALLMIPSILTLVPLFSLIIKLNLLNSWFGLWGPFIAGGQIFCIFVLRSFFSSLPEEMFEAARLDGAGELRILHKMVIPLSRPILSTLAVLNVLGTWNEYVWPLMVINEHDKMPLPVGLMSFQQMFTTNWGPLFAGYVIASIPLIILFAVASRQFVEGLAFSSTKM